MDEKPKSVDNAENLETLADRLAHILREVYNNNPRGYTKVLNLLADGKAIQSSDIATAFGYPKLVVKAYFWASPPLNSFDLDSKNNIIGAGLTLKKTDHHFTIRGNQLYTWCAMDSLFFPLMLKESAQVMTPCPITKTPISLTISPDGISDLDVESAVASFMLPDINEAKSDIRASFCSFAKLLKDDEAAAQWQKQHPTAIVLSLEDAFKFSQRVISTLYEKQPEADKSSCVLQ